MQKINTTTHAKKRMQQRAISEIQIRLIEEFGRYEYQKGGTSFAYITNKTLTELLHAIDKLPGLAIVCGESDRIITALHQHQQIKNTSYIS